MSYGNAAAESTGVIAAALAVASDAAGDLRIARVRATPVNIALKAPYEWSAGCFPGFSKTIVEVETESGLTGVGEAASSWSAEIIERALAPRLIGGDPRDLAACERRALPPFEVMRNVEDESLLRAWGGMEMALWDLNGKLQGRSVAELLGGLVRSAISYTEYFAPRLASGSEGGESTPAAVADYCARMQEQHGARAFEGKVGLGGLDFEVAMVREIRKAIGEQPMLRLDANMGWSLMTAREALRRLAQFNLRSIEDPVATLQEMARLRPASDISFSTHMPELGLVGQFGVPDAIVVGISALGGIARTVAFAHACQHLGVELWFYSPDTGVANAAYRQVAAAVEWISEPSQTLMRWHTDDVTTAGPIAPRDGVIEVSRAPGLGVALDPKAMRRCNEAYRAHGPYDQYEHPTRPGRYGPRRLALNRRGC
jgi:glucarate dehydratase